jgi:hypothetical protein
MSEPYKYLDNFIDEQRANHSTVNGIVMDPFTMNYSIKIRKSKRITACYPCCQENYQL